MNTVWIVSTLQHVKPLITYWPGKVHGVVGITEELTILILDGLTPSGSVSSVVCRMVSRNFGLLSSVRPGVVFCGG